MTFLTIPAGLCTAIAFLCLTASVVVAQASPVSGVVVPITVTLKPSSFESLPTVEEYTLPTRYSGPFGMAIDKQDRIWITLMVAHSLGVLDPATGVYKEYRIPSTKDLPEVDWNYDSRSRTTPDNTVTNYSVGNPGSIIVAPDGLVWFVMLLGNSVVRFDPAKEEFTEFILPTPNAQPYDLAADGKGRIWFVEKNGGSFGYLDTTKETIAEISLGEGANLTGITVGPEGNVWISDANNNFLARYRPAEKSFAQFPVMTPHAQPGMLRFDKNGFLWFCQLRTRQLGVYMPDPGIFSVVDIPGYNATPQSLAFDDSSRVWFVDSMMNRIGFFESEKLTMRIFELTTGNAQPMDVELDSKGDVWFTENDRNANRIARLRVSTIPPEVTGAPIGAVQSAAGSGSGNGLFLWVIAGLGVVCVIFLLRRRR